MRLKIIKGFIKWYRKWVLRECPHICFICKYKDMCKGDEEWWGNINNHINYKEK